MPQKDRLHEQRPPPRPGTTPARGRQAGADRNADPEPEVLRGRGTCGVSPFIKSRNSRPAERAGTAAPTLLITRHRGRTGPPMAGCKGSAMDPGAVGTAMMRGLRYRSRQT